MIIAPLVFSLAWCYGGSLGGRTSRHLGCKISGKKHATFDNFPFFSVKACSFHVFWDPFVHFRACSGPSRKRESTVKHARCGPLGLAAHYNHTCFTYDSDVWTWLQTQKAKFLLYFHVSVSTLGKRVPLPNGTSPRGPRAPRSTHPSGT